ncbi:MAG: chemotaxis protein CheD [Syntrophomonadaceae bacterium]|jgi:chemotaxis protein CheD
MQKLKPEAGLEIRIGIAEYGVCKAPGILITLALGSCMGVSLFDRVTGIGGMVHVMLPDSKLFNGPIIRSKFADTAIPLLLEEVLKLGASKKRLEAKIAGGAQMFKSQSNSSLLNIGERNTFMCRKVLNELQIRITGMDTGGHIGRTMILDCGQAKTFVRTYGKITQEI